MIYIETADLFESKRSYLGELVLKGFIAADKSHKSLFHSISSNDQQRLSIALAYLNDATSFFVSAQTFFVDNLNLFDNKKVINDTFSRFYLFHEEFMDNVDTNHSHQWTDIEFRNFVDQFNLAKTWLNVDMDNFFSDLALSE